MNHLYVHADPLFWLLLFLYIVAEYGFSIRARILRRGKAKQKKLDRGSFFLVMLGMNFFVFLSFVFGFRKLGELPFYMSYVGDVLIIIGTVIRFSAIIQLGRFFSVTVGVVADQKLIQTGLYKKIRNPSYTGVWLVAIGFALALRTWWGALLTAIGVLFIFAYRIHVEEKAMIQQFGDKYVSYMRRTKKMFPWIW